MDLYGDLDDKLLDGKLKASSGSSVWTPAAAQTAAAPAFVPQAVRNASNTSQQQQYASQATAATASMRPSPVVTANSMHMLPGAVRTKSPNALPSVASNSSSGISLAFRPASLTRKAPPTSANAATVELSHTNTQRAGIGFGFASVPIAVRVQPAAPASLDSGIKPAFGTKGRDTEFNTNNVENQPPPAVATATSSSAGLFHANYHDEYDPSRPNSYEAYCEQRIAKKKLELVRHELDRRQRNQEIEGKREREQLVRDIAAGTAPTAQLAAAGRGRGMTVPAWMRKKMEETTAAAAAAATTTTTTTERTAAATAPVDSKQFADADGDADTRHTGLGFRAASSSSHDASGSTLYALQRPSAVEPIKPRGCVILLQNMVGPGDVDDELQDEVRDECEAKYGRVVACVVFEAPATARVAPEHAVRIFVQFEHPRDAEKARLGLNARFFGGRKVVATHYDDDTFDRRILTA